MEEEKEMQDTCPDQPIAESKPTEEIAQSQETSTAEESEATQPELTQPELTSEAQGTVEPKNQA